MRLQGAIFAAGVVLSFAVLAAIMLALRAGGAQLGWGFQLQSPASWSCSPRLFFLLGAQPLRRLRVGARSPRRRLGLAGAAACGAFSRRARHVVATPCTAPFMGSALGFDLTQHRASRCSSSRCSAWAWRCPSSLLSASPCAAARLPKPGAWMETFKQALAFPLFAACAWLAWVLGRRPETTRRWHSCWAARASSASPRGCTGAGRTPGADGSPRSRCCWVPSACSSRCRPPWVRRRGRRRSPAAKARPGTRGRRRRCAPCSRRAAPCSSTSRQRGARPASGTSASRCATTRW